MSPTMPCQKCGKRPATVHRESIVFRQKVEEHLCPLCAGVPADENPLMPGLPATYTQTDIWRRERASMLVTAACSLLQSPLGENQRRSAWQILFNGLQLLLQAQSGCPASLFDAPITPEPNEQNDLKIGQFELEAIKLAKHLRDHPDDCKNVIAKLWGKRPDAPPNRSADA